VGLFSLWREMKDSNFNFNYFGQYPNIEELKNLVNNLTNKDWRYFTKRQTIASQNAYTIPLIYPQKSTFKPGEHKFFEVFENHLMEIEEQLSLTVKRSILVMLPAGNSINRHKDTGEFLNKNRRVHLPVITNKMCRFVVEDEEMFMPEGEFWEINNTGKYHSVHNDGEIDRIHLIIDVG
jgi:hypothetical protein